MIVNASIEIALLNLFSYAAPPEGAEYPGVTLRATCQVAENAGWV